MVVGEAQILAQVKQAYELAGQIGSTGPLTHRLFQAALRVARRVASETSLHRHRVSIPSVAIADFAARIFERFDDKRVLVIGAGKMAQETLHYLTDAGARRLVILNRDFDRALELAAQWHGMPAAWDVARRPARRPPTWSSAPPAPTGPSSRSTTISSTSPAAGTSGRCLSSTWPCRAISTRPSARSWACICTASTT